MRRLAFGILFNGLLFLTGSAQEIDDVNGKTYYYYDVNSKKKIKEIFHHIQEFRMVTDNHGNTTDTMVYIKSGPYTRYHENGTLECSGFYDREKKTGTWKYYTSKGVLIKTEQWADDKLIKTTVNSPKK